MSTLTKNTTVEIVDVQLVRQGELVFSQMKINSASACVDVFRKYLGEKDREHFVLICLNTKNTPTHIQTVHIGDISSAIINPREVFKVAILTNARSIIVAHNHPSGNCDPSPEDKQLTDRLVQSGKLLDIPLLDHLIVTEHDHYSFKERNLI